MSLQETELLRAYDGDPALLGTTERYFLEMSTVPRLQLRLRAWASKQRFAAQHAEMTAGVAQLRDGPVPDRGGRGSVAVILRKICAGEVPSPPPVVRVHRLILGQPRPRPAGTGARPQASIERRLEPRTLRRGGVGSAGSRPAH